MTPNEFMDAQKLRGHRIERCLDCGLRAYGGGALTHMFSTNHRMVNEDTLTSETVSHLDKLRILRTNYERFS